jgi:protein-tyrosine phosphatase
MPIYSLIDHLSVGPYDEALSPPDDIGALLNVAEEHDLPATDRITHKVPVTDMQPIPVDQLEEAVRWIDAHIDDNHIYLFCNAGVGRSPSVAVSYLCCYRGYTFGEAVEYVARRKSDVSTLPELIDRIEAVRARLDAD